MALSIKTYQDLNRKTDAIKTHSPSAPLTARRI